MLFEKKYFPKLKKAVSKSKKGMFQIEHEMERQLAKKIKIYGNVEYNRNAILVAIVRIALKGLYEIIRKLKISKYGGQQLQMDIYFLEVLFRDLIGIEDETGYGKNLNIFMVGLLEEFLKKHSIVQNKEALNIKN